MEQQLNFTDIEYSQRKRSTKRDEFLKKMDKIIPWSKWVELVRPYYFSNKRGRRPMEIETMLRMVMLQVWFNLSDEGLEDSVYDSYAMRSFLNLDFANGIQVPDATTLCKFRKLLNAHHLQEQIFEQVKELLKENGMEVRGGSIVDATIVPASRSRKNNEKQSDPEMHSVKKGNNWYFGLREHVAVDPVHGFVHTICTTAANGVECKIAPKLLRADDKVVYGDAGYLKMERYVTDGVERDYRINLQVGTFKRYHSDNLAWQYEYQRERRKSSIRCKVEHVFHIVKDIFHWRKARYKGIAKNHGHANLLFASANLYMLATSSVTVAT